MKKTIGLLLVLVMSLSMLVAPALAADATLRFSWWGGDARHEATLKNIDRYAELFPNVTVEPEYGGFDGYLDRYYIQLAGKQQPDISQIDFKWVYDLMTNYQERFVNLYNLEGLDLSQFDPDFLAAVCGTEDFLIGIPLGTNCYGMIYNVEFFEKFGLTDPGKWTWEDLIVMGEKVQEQDPESHLLCSRLSNFAYIVRFMLKQRTGVDMISEDGKLTFTEEDMTYVFDYILRLVTSGTLPPFEELMPYGTSYPEQTPGWVEARYGLAFSMGSTAVATITGSPFEIKTLYTPVLADAKNSGWATTASQLYAISADGANREEAVKFVNYLLNDDEAILVTGDTRGIPSNLHGAELLSEQGLIRSQVMEINEKSAELGMQVENGQTLDSNLHNLIQEFVQEVGYKKLTPEAAAKAFIVEAEKIFAK